MNFKHISYDIFDKFAFSNAILNDKYETMVINRNDIDDTFLFEHNINYVIIRSLTKNRSSEKNWMKLFINILIKFVS